MQYTAVQSNSDSRDIPHSTYMENNVSWLCLLWIHASKFPPPPPQIEAGLASGAIDPDNFNPTPYEKDTPEYNLAMINFLLKMGDRGHDINTLEIDKVSDSH